MIGKGNSLPRLAALYLGSLLAGFAFSSAGLPLPWMIGPMVVTALLTLSGVSSVVVPVATRPYGQAIVSSQVALFFTAAAFQALVRNIPLMICLGLVVVALAFSVALLMSRLAAIPVANALVALLPTSPVEASVTAERHGYNPAPVILSQIIRNASVVIAIPMTLYFIDGAPDKSLRILEGGDDLRGQVVFAIAALSGGLLGRKLRIANPFFLGPLILVAGLNALGLPFDRFPAWVLSAAQILLGTWLGSTFRPSLFSSAGRFVSVAVFCSTFFVAICALTGALISMLLGLPFETMVIASAPGGVTEMALTAKVLHADVSLITAFHLTRILIIVPNISWVIRLVDRYERRGGG